jgi:O2-independent ubiquinone biosynthesis accessory factor UbiT
MWHGSLQAGGRQIPPPFSPALLLGMTLRPFNPSLFQPLFNSCLQALLRSHPDILDRMEPYAQAVICIDPIDLPFVILFRPDPARPSLSLCRRDGAATASATVRGSLATLMALAEGLVDGDALFFSRQLVIEGDTEVVVAFRNAIDGAGINLVEDFAVALGPWARPARAVAHKAFGLLGRVKEDVETLCQAMLAPTRQQLDTQSSRLAEVETQVKELARLAQTKSRGQPA